MRKNWKTKLQKTLGFSTTITIITAGLIFIPPTAASATQTPPVEPPTTVTLKVENETETQIDLVATVDNPLEESNSVLDFYQTGTPTTIHTAHSGTDITYTVPKPTTKNYEQYYVEVGTLTSNTVTVHSATTTWKLTIHPTQTSFATNDQTPTLEWETNQTIPTNKALFFVEKTTNTIIGVTAGDNISTSGQYVPSRFNTGPPREYITYLADYNPQTPYTTVTDITNIETISNSYFIQRKPWEITLTTDTLNYSTDQPTPNLTWQTNQPTPNYWETNNYAVYLTNNLTGEIITVQHNGTTTGTTQHRFYSEQNIEYVAYIALYNSNIGYSNVTQLQDIQATSNTVIVTRTPWVISASIDVNSYTTDSNPPVIYWETNQTINLTNNNYAVYVTDTSDGSVLTVNPNVGKNGSYTVPKFWVETEKSYELYVAKYQSNVWVNNVTQLQDIQAISNIVTTSREPWEIAVSISSSAFTTDDPTPTVNWETNQSINLTNNNYAVYVEDVSTGEIIGVSNSQGTTGSLPITRFLTGDGRTYRAYVAKYQSNVWVNNVSQLLDIQATSNTVGTQRAPWTVNVNISDEIFSTSDPTPKIFWETNQNVNIGNYNVYLVEVGTGTIVNRGYNSYWSNDLGSSGDLNIERFFTGGSRSYQVYVAKSGYGVNPSNLTQLEDIQAVSNTVSTQRDTWLVTIGVDKTVFSTSESAPVVTWEANQAINTDASGYIGYLVDMGTGKIVDRSLASCSYSCNPTSGPTGELKLGEFVTGGSKTFKLYVAKGVWWNAPGFPLTVDDLVDVQTVSNEVTVSRAVWNVSLDIVKVEAEPWYDSYMLTYTLKWSTNQWVNPDGWGSPYRVWVFDQANGRSAEDRFIHNFNVEEGTVTYRVSQNSPAPLFTAYVAEATKPYNQVYTRNDVKDVQAISNIVNASNYSDQVIAESNIGGGNPSGADCNQQCYGDPVNSYNGEFFENTTDLEIKSLLPFNFSRSYSSFNTNKTGTFGAGWTHNYDMRLEWGGLVSSDADEIKIFQENNSVISFVKATSGDDEKYVSPRNVQATLEYNPTLNQYIFTRKNNLSYIFDATTGNLVTIQDLNGNKLTLTYVNQKLTQISSTDNKTLNIIWANNQITQITDGTQTVTYSYNPAGNVSIVDLPNLTGHKQYVYNTENQITRVIHPNGGGYQNYYDTEGRVEKQVNPLDGETTFGYTTTTTGTKTLITLPDGTQNEETYNLFGQLVTQKIAYGTVDEKVYSYEYGPSGEKNKETDPAGNITRYTHDFKGNVLTVTDALNRTSRFKYNSLNQIIETTNPLGQKYFTEYDPKGNIVSTTTPSGKKTGYTQNLNGTLHSITSPNQTLNQVNPKPTIIGYDLNNNVNTVTQPEGSTTTTLNNLVGNPTQIQSPTGKTTQYVYTSNQQLVETITPNLQSSTVEYDNAGQVVKTTDSLGRETVYTYDLMGNVLTVTTVAGVVSYEYDNMQRVVKMVAVDGGETVYSYNNVGQPVKITDPMGNETTMDYYSHGLIHTVTDALGHTVSYEYDAVGNTVKVVDDNGGESTAVYDVLNRVVLSTSSNGYTESYSFDVDGNLVSTTKAGLETTTYEYDSNGNLTGTVYPDFSREERTYDADDLLVSIKDRDGKITSYQYDGDGQIIKMVRPDATEVEYSYTLLGQIDQVSYDNWVTVDTDYDYDVHGRMVSETKNGVTVTYDYDAIGNMTRRGPPTGDSVEYFYDTHGTITGVKYPSGVEVAYTYDLNGNLTTVLKDNDLVASYEYDEVNNLTKTIYGNGTFEVNEYDNLNRLSSISLQNSAGEFYKKQLNLDPSGLIIQGDVSVNSTSVEEKTFDYTATQRLETVTDNLSSLTKTYGFDSSNNLVSSPWGTNTVTPNGRLTASSTQTATINYTHDGLGNRVTKTSTYPTAPNKTETITYGWTVDNKLEQYKKTVTETTGTTKTDTTNTVNYTYDSYGLLSNRQTSTTTLNTTNGLPGTETTATTPEETFTWDTLNSVPLLLEDGTNNYLYDMSDSPFAQVNKTTGDVEYLHGDERGSVVAASVESGEFSWYQSYDEYGYEVDQTPQSGVDNVVTRFGYAGEYQDPVTGLYNLRARWYEPETGSFLTVDPALSSTGEGYSYGSANPLSYTDPLGLWSLQNTWNSAAGFLDGVTGIPIASTISNWLVPGSVQTCSLEYGVANIVGTVASFLIPGVAAIKVLGLVAKAVSVFKVGARAAANFAKTGSKFLRFESSKTEILKNAKEKQQKILDLGLSQVAQNRKIGKLYEEVVQQTHYPKGIISPQTFFMTPHGRRFVDIDNTAIDGTIVEVKNVISITMKKYGNQLAKDAYIVNDPTNNVTKAVWHVHPRTHIEDKFIEEAVDHGITIRYGPEL